MLENVDNLIKAAAELQDFLGANSGDTDDWPIDLVARDKVSADKLTELLQTHHDALEPFRK